QTQEELEADIEQRQEAVIASRRDYQEIESRLTALQREIAEKENEVQTAKNRIEFIAERSHELSILIRQNETDIETTSTKLNSQEEDLKNADAMIVSVDQKIAQIEGRLTEHETAAAEARAERQRLSEALAAMTRERTELESRIASLGARIESHTRQLQADQQRFVQLDEEVGRLRKEEQGRHRDADGLRTRIEDQRKNIERAEEELADMEHRYQQARRDLEEFQNQIASVHRTFSEKSSRLDVLRQLVAEGEGFEKGTQAVLKGLDRPELFRKAVRGALASFISVDSEFVPAIEAALGRHLQTIVVADALVAESMVKALKQGKLGRASLVCEDFVRPAVDRQLLTVPAEAIGWALDRIDCHERVRSLVDRLLENVLIVPRLAEALKLRREMPGVAFATLEGDFVSVDGIIHGGAGGDAAGSFLQRQTDIRTLEGLTKALGAQLAKMENRRDGLHGKIEEFEGRLQQRRERLQQRQLGFSATEGQIALIERDLQGIENRLESLRWEQQEVAKRQDELDEQIKEASIGMTEAANRIDAIEESSMLASQSFEAAEVRERQAVETVSELRTDLAVEKQSRETLQNQRGPMAGRLAELQDLLDRRHHEIDTYRGRIESGAEETTQLQARIEAAGEESTGLSEEVNRVRSEREKHVEAIREHEDSLGDERKEIQRLAKQRGEEEIRVARVKMRLEQLESAARERYRSELELFEPDSHTLLLVIDNQRASFSRNEKRRSPLAGRDDGGDGTEEGENFSENEAGDEEVAAAGGGGDDEGFELEMVDDPGEPDWEFVESIVSDLRGRLDGMGPVNLDAIEEFEELEQHYRFNVDQLRDLENSKEELLRMIARINRDTRKMFGETFEQIRKNFQEMFRELFGDRGKADLLLEDDGDPLESGIEVIAKPPGKKLQSISLLSGGERSMTAVALLFAIYMVKPSPFCVLDELDAPLDDTNIGRFIRVLDRFIGESQFIIVTHSKRTMSRADVMYGVSMEEFGVSKTVGMKFTKGEGEKARAEEPELVEA
ncbi:MAG: chromosome segregation protein SMC, partial [Verrucomicrobiae bacterium]|nr:chromosome segregation protein SMC [Verrucomicrobiae bacterium]